MIVYNILVDDKTLYDMYVEEMTVDNVILDELSLGKMSWYMYV